MEVEVPGFQWQPVPARLHQRVLGKANGHVWMEDMLLAKMAKMQGVLRKSSGCLKAISIQRPWRATQTWSVVTTSIPVGLEGTDSCPKHYKDLGAQACGCYCGLIQPLSKILN